MSEELIAAILVGPMKLDPDLRGKAIEQAQAVVNYSKALVCLDEDKETGVLTDSAYDDACTRLLEQYDQERVGHLENAESEDLELLATLDPVIVVDSLYDAWDGNSGDCQYRQTPHDPDKKIFVCGASTWGDSPDGYGYQAIDRADRCHILPILGIE